MTMGANSFPNVYQAEIRFVGVTSSPAYVREPETNGCAERFVRTLKEQPLRSESSIPSRSSTRPSRISCTITATPGSSNVTDTSPLLRPG